MRVFLKYSIVLVAFFSLNGLALAQDTTLIEQIGNCDISYDSDINPDAYMFVGDVIFRQDSTLFYCDSALMDDKSNNMFGYYHVRIVMEDSLTIYGDSLHYFGNSKMAHIFGDVKMVDDKGTLYTDLLKYNRRAKIGFYETWGRIVDSANILTSNKGYFYTQKDEIYFKDNVVLVNPDYTMYSDTCMYNTETEVIYAHGPTKVVSEENTLFGEKGWYDTKKDLGQFHDNSYLDNGKQLLLGDSLYYDRNIDYGRAIQNVMLIDTAKDVVTLGHYSEYFKMDSFAYVTDSAVAIMIDSEKKDSLFMHADTLKVWFDKNDEVNRLQAFYKTKFFKNDMQGMSDSLEYLINDSVINMYHDPVLWLEGNQLSGDTIMIRLKNEEIHTLDLVEHSFIISHDTLDNYNQIKGKNMTASFKDNELNHILVTGNSQSVYFVREEETGDLIGINKAESSYMRIYIKDSEIDQITYIKSPKAPMYPERDLAPSDRILKDFKWWIDRKPNRKEDIFVW
ncbi:MAG: hypothetical protein JEZ03_07915 [Bacteroidales bacterium]|nr:hypothetical protein [Bacteroidales bacterium]